MSVKQRVDSALQQGNVVVFTFSNCPNCIATKKTLSDSEVQFHDVVLDKWDPSDKEAALDYLETLSGARTVPRVFIGGKCIGGNHEFQQQFVKGGRLNELRGA